MTVFKNGTQAKTVFKNGTPAPKFIKTKMVVAREWTEVDLMVFTFLIIFLCMNRISINSYKRNRKPVCENCELIE